MGYQGLQEGLVSLQPDKLIGSKADALELLEDIKEDLIAIATEVRKEEESLGFDKEAKIRVDDSWNTPLKFIKPLGKVEWHERADVSEMILNTYASILRMSPIGKGVYQNNNLVFVDSTLIGNSAATIKLWLETNDVKPNQTIRFINRAPYARKLERYGYTRYTSASPSKRNEKKLKMFKPNGVYTLVSRQLIRKYKGAGFVNFGWFGNGSQGINLNLPAPGVKSSRTTHAPREDGKGGYLNGYEPGRPYVYPVISIRIFSDGVQNGGLLQ